MRTVKVTSKKLAKIIIVIIAFGFFVSFTSQKTTAQEKHQVAPGNFGLPGLLDLPTAKRFPDGELVFTQQLHKSLARSGLSFQALPRVGFSFRYTGHGFNGNEAYGRVNHDRSFDAHISLFDEKKFLPAVSLGLRDFIGTGWYSSEYIVGTKSIGKFELTAGLGYGRLAGKNAFSNPLGKLSERFDRRDGRAIGTGGTLGTINWFQGDAAAFYGLRLKINNKITVSSEYTPDLMWKESNYLSVESPWNFGASYKVNDYFDLSTQYLHGNQLSVTAHINVNPDKPPLLGGKELAPVPMRLRSNNTPLIIQSNEEIIRKVLKADRFELHYLKFELDTVNISITNTKFRSTAQAVGRLASTLQRFTSDEIKFAQISFYSNDLKTVTYRIDLEKVSEEQFGYETTPFGKPSVMAIDQMLCLIVKT